MAKRLYRSFNNKMLGGICGGLAEYFDVDPSVLRILAVISLFVSGGMTILVYIVAWIIIPLNEPGEINANTDKAKAEPVKYNETPRLSPWTSYLPGLALIFFGCMLLIREHWFWFSWGEMWPMILIALGLVLIFSGKRALHKQADPEMHKENSKAQNHGAVS